MEWREQGGSLAVLLLLILFQCITFLCGQVTFVSGQVNGKYTCPKDKCLKKAMSSSDGWEEHFDLSTLLPYLKRDTRRYDCLADGVLCIIFCHGTMTNPSCKKKTPHTNLHAHNHNMVHFEGNCYFILLCDFICHFYS